MSRKVTVSAAQLQMRELESFDQFSSQVESLAKRASESDLVVFPELVTTPLFTLLDDWRARPASDLGKIAKFSDAYVELFSELCKKYEVAIQAGSHLFETEDGLKNVAYLFSADGTMHAHEKTHIFPAEAEWGTGEGDEFEVVDLGMVKVGTAICYEAEIPEVATILSRRGAELLLVPSYTFTAEGFYRVHKTTAARCIENQIYAVHCPTIGDLGDPLAPGRGKSTILSPCDEVFPTDGIYAEAQWNVEDLITATLDLDVLAENRESGAATTFNDRQRRGALYGRYKDVIVPG